VEPARSEGRDLEPARKLYRRRGDRMLAGVCGGLADYFRVDVTLIRVIFIVLAVMGGAGLVIYLAMWLLVPEEPRTAL
jgi:phage shock protein C